MIVVDTGETSRSSDLEVAAGLRGRVRGYASNRFPGDSPRRWSISSAAVRPVPEEPQTHEGRRRPPSSPTRSTAQGEDGDHAVSLADDSSYTQDLTLRGSVDAPSPHDAVAQLTHERIRALTTQTPTVYLVAHDPDTAARLANCQVVEGPAVEPGKGSRAGDANRI